MTDQAKLPEEPYGFMAYDVVGHVISQRACNLDAYDDLRALCEQQQRELAELHQRQTGAAT